jgi:hypothetical protein
MQIHITSIFVHGGVKKQLGNLGLADKQGIKQWQPKGDS